MYKLKINYFKLFFISISCTAFITLPELFSDSDTVIKNAAVYTVNEAQPLAEAVAIKDGKIIFVGSNSKVIKFIGSKTNVIDADDRLILPGIQDAHMHPIEAGINSRNSILPQFGNESAYRKALKQTVKKQPDADWIIGAGVNMISLLENIDSPLDLIDEIIPNQPAIILDDLGHGVWANSLALKAVGYDKKTQNPQGGIIDRDPDTNELTGIVFESASQNLIDAANPPTPPNLDFAYDNFLQTQKKLAKNGITTVSDAGGYWPRGHHEIWYRAEREGTLTLRASNALYLYPDRLFAKQISELTALLTNDPNKLVRFNQVKIYIDGIISQATAALYQPYEANLKLSPEEQLGFLYFKINTLNKYAAALERAGFQIHFHATGDRGVGLALDAIEYAHNKNKLTDRRHRITHLFLVDKRDRARFAKMRVYADFQLARSTVSDKEYKYIKKFIGKRVEEYLPIQSLKKSGVNIVLSSDWDADELSPWLKIETAITRENENVTDVKTAIEMMTINTASLLQHDNKTGSIEVGKQADLIMLDRDIFSVPINQISNTKVLLTLLGGKEIYRSTNL